MDKHTLASLIGQAAASGDEVRVNFKEHAPAILRSLANQVESGEVRVGVAELRMDRENMPYFTYVISVADEGDH